MELREIREKARSALRGNWGLGIGASILAFIIPLAPMITITPFFGPGGIELGMDQLIGIFLSAPLAVGVKWIFLGFIDDEKKSMGNLFDSFSNYWRVVGISFLRGLFVFLWALLAIIPGIIMGAFLIGQGVNSESGFLILLGTLIMFVPAVVVTIIVTIRYSQALYLVKDKPAINVMDAIRESKEMMIGYKGKYFLLQIFFALWYLPGTALMFTAGAFLLRPASSAFPNILDNIGNFYVEIYTFDSIYFGERAMLVAILLILISVIYIIGIAFYVIPYQQGANAAFYRRLQPAKKESFMEEQNIASESPLDDFSQLEIPNLEIPNDNLDV